MRRLFLLGTAAAALAGAAGVVTAAPPSLTLTASPTTVSYGGTTTLSGKLSTQRSGQTVTIEAQECGKNAFSRLATVTTTTGGAYSFVAKPNLNTNFRARVKGSTSPTAPLLVRPVVALRKLALRRFSATVTAAQSFQGKFVYVQRYRPAVRKWTNVTRVTLKSLRTMSASAMATSSTFRVRIARRVRVRALLPRLQAQPCYIAAFSNVVRS